MTTRDNSAQTQPGEGKNACVVEGDDYPNEPSSPPCDMEGTETFLLVDCEAEERP